MVFQFRPFWIYGSVRHRYARQISPGKNAMFPCTSAAFTLSAAPSGFAMRCQLARRPGLLCDFCPSPRTFALRLPPDKPSRTCPCLRPVVILVACDKLGTPTGDFHPITSRPCWAHTRRSTSLPSVAGRCAMKPRSAGHLYVEAVEKPHLMGISGRRNGAEDSAPLSF